MSKKKYDPLTSFSAVPVSKVSFDTVQSLLQENKIILIVSKHNAFNILLGFRCLKFANDKTYLRSSVMANIFWCTLALSMFFYSVYLSFTFHWASFIGGIFVMQLIYSANADSNVSNLLQVYQSDKLFFDNMKQYLTIYVHQDSLDKLDHSE